MNRPAAGPHPTRRTVLLASPRSFCAGAERAIEVVERALARFGAPVYVRRQIVHNVHVCLALERAGAVFVGEVDEAPPGALCVLSAHGVAPAVRARAGRRLRVIDATCPLVTRVHRDARRLVEAGHRVVLIGHPGHDEVEGTLGEAPGRIDVVSRPEQVAYLPYAAGDPVAYLTQTTLAADEVDAVVAALRRRFPRLHAPGARGVCYATANRQRAVRELAVRCGIVLVIGSAASSNSRRLVEVARREGCEARLLEDAGELDPRWLAGIDTVGVTAGASTPNRLVDEVVEALAALGPIVVGEHRVADESMRFLLPPELRRVEDREMGDGRARTARRAAGSGR